MLEHKLIDLSKISNRYPFHMPGHKRMKEPRFPNPYTIDITEIDGFDNLHHPEGIIKKEQDCAAEFYGSRQCFYLVNGSSCGILAAISAVSKRGDKILLARNCHQSVFHACYLRQLSPVYAYPEGTASGLQGQVTAFTIRRLLEANPDVCAVVITSPTYDGIVSDVQVIARLVHKRNIPLIVDEAHGAHFGLHKAFPENATRLGADVVVMSIHKTLPALTQTALLHLCSDRVDPEEVARFLRIYETSSPSYVLLAGISRCMRLIKANTIKESFDDYVEMLEAFRERSKNLINMRVFGAEDFNEWEAYAYDIGKIIIYTGVSGMSGPYLYRKLAQIYGLQAEMASGSYVLAMTSYMDTQRGFDRLYKALWALDAGYRRGEVGELFQPSDIYREQEKCMEICDAADAPRERVPLWESLERICATYIYFYPPGVPILVPGEKITEWTLLDIEDCLEIGMKLDGLGPDKSIEVVKMA